MSSTRKSNNPNLYEKFPKEGNVIYRKTMKPKSGDDQNLYYAFQIAQQPVTNGNTNAAVDSEMTTTWVHIGGPDEQDLLKFPASMCCDLVKHFMECRITEGSETRSTLSEGMNGTKNVFDLKNLKPTISESHDIRLRVYHDAHIFGKQRQNHPSTSYWLGSESSSNNRSHYKQKHLLKLHQSLLPKLVATLGEYLF